MRARKHTAIMGNGWLGRWTSKKKAIETAQFWASIRKDSTTIKVVDDLGNVVFEI